MALYVRVCFDIVVEFNTENDNFRSLWVRIRRMDSRADILGDSGRSSRGNLSGAGTDYCP